MAIFRGKFLLRFNCLEDLRGGKSDFPALLEKRSEIKYKKTSFSTESKE